MTTEVPGLLVAGEAVGGANGANRLSGNAITEALVFGREAGRTAAERAKTIRNVPSPGNAAQAAIDLINAPARKDAPNMAEMLQNLQQIMADDVGPLRTGETLERALKGITGLDDQLGASPAGDGGAFDMERLDWFDLRNMLMVARSVTEAALLRTESRGAHQREDFPGMEDAWRLNQVIRLKNGRIDITRGPTLATEMAAQ
jgi:succinate dehydrogenase/fumarate reductase flavoprotein subunit